MQDRIFCTSKITVILCIVVSYKISHLYNSDAFKKKTKNSVFPFKITEMGKCTEAYCFFRL